MSNKLAIEAPTLLKANYLINAKIQSKLNQKKSEIDILVGKIDDWLEIYNNYKVNKLN